MLQRITGARVTREWLNALPLVRKAIDRSLGQMNAASLHQGLLDERLQLWMDSERAHPIAVVTGVSVYVETRMLTVVLLGGRNMPQWIDEVEATLAEFARSLDCVALEACVRRGLIGATYQERRAALKGWTPYLTLIRKPLSAFEEAEGAARTDRERLEAPRPIL